jgi:hypothetical protein
VSVESILEEILDEFAKRFDEASSASELSHALSDLRREIARGDAVGGADYVNVMVRGMVVKQPVFAPFASRLDALEKSAEARIRTFAKASAKKTDAAWTHTLRLFFPASVTGGATIAKCVGARDETDLDGVKFGAPVVSGSSMWATVCENAKRLEVVIDIPLAKKPTAKQISAIRKTVEASLDHGWGLNYEFDVPRGNVRFDAKVRRAEVVTR